MSPQGIALHFIVVAFLAALPVQAMAAQQPAIDAEGRVFGDTINDPLPEWKQPLTVGGQPQLPQIPSAYSPASVQQLGAEQAAWERARADWLAECRQRFGGRGTVTGGVVGGLVGGIAGSAIAGRGHRTIGAVVGGAAGALAGAAIGASSDRQRSRDYCENYLDRYLASTGQDQGGYAFGANQVYAYPEAQMTYGYAMQPMMVLVPVALMTVAVSPVAARAAPRQVYSEVIEEWVPVTRAARRHIPRRAAPVKRVRVYPGKRVRVY